MRLKHGRLVGKPLAIRLEIGAELWLTGATGWRRLQKGVRLQQMRVGCRGVVVGALHGDRVWVEHGVRKSVGRQLVRVEHSLELAGSGQGILSSQGHGLEPWAAVRVSYMPVHNLGSNTESVNIALPVNLPDDPLVIVVTQ